jgi:putative membrane protein
MSSLYRIRWDSNPAFPLCPAFGTADQIAETADRQDEERAGLESVSKRSKSRKEGVDMWHMGDGWGWWMIFGSLMMVGFWIAVIWAVSAVVRGSSAPGRDKASPSDPTALEILARRYASGEISDEEFEMKRRKLLQAGRDSS